MSQTENSQSQTLNHYQAQAALANLPVLLNLLEEARYALGPEFSYLARRIDSVIAQSTPRGEPVLGSLS